MGARFWYVVGGVLGAVLLIACTVLHARCKHAAKQRRRRRTQMPTRESMAQGPSELTLAPARASKRQPPARAPAAARTTLPHCPTSVPLVPLMDAERFAAIGYGDSYTPRTRTTFSEAFSPRSMEELLDLPDAVQSL